MKPTLLVVALLVVVSGCREAPQQRATHLLDALALLQLDGSSTRLTGTPGRLLLINLWTTWCGPCKNEIETLKLMQPELQAKQCDIVGIVLDAARPAYLRRVVQQGPATIIVDSQGMILQRLTGVRTADELRRVVDACRTAQPMNPTQQHRSTHE